MQAGLINGIQYLGGGLIAPIWGVIADRRNAHRCMSVFVAIMAVLCTCAVPLLVEVLGRISIFSVFLKSWYSLIYSMYFKPLSLLL